jgi:hypothetical protein
MKIQLKTTLFLLGAVCAGSAIAAPLLQVNEDIQVHLLADAEFVYESNLFLQSTNAVSGRYFVFSPGLELRIAQQGSASAVLRYQHQFTSFLRGQSELDGDYKDLDFRLNYDSGVVLASGYATYKDMFTSTIDANRDGELIERTHSNIGGSLRYEISELTAIKAGVDVAEVDYKDFFYTDHESVSVPVTLFYKVRPRVELTGGLRYRTVDTSGGFQEAYDYNDFYYFVGAVGELFSPVIFADISVGYQTRDFDGESLDASSASYDITFIYTGDAKTTVYAGLSRDYNTSAIGGQTYAFTSASLGARYSLTEAIGFNAGFVVGENEYEESPRAEDIMILNLGASYQPNDFLTLSAGYKYTDVEGANIFSSDYANKEIRVSASLRY